MAFAKPKWSDLVDSDKESVAASIASGVDCNEHTLNAHGFCVSDSVVSEVGQPSRNSVVESGVNYVCLSSSSDPESNDAAPDDISQSKCSCSIDRWQF